MSYPFRTTYKQDSDTYIEDRGYAHTIKRGDADFDVVDTKFGNLLTIGKTAQPSMEGDGWEVIDGFPLLERIQAQELANAKAVRANAVAAITVTVNGKVFDGDETAQIRMARAVAASNNAEETTQWVLHNNEVVTVTIAELKQALRLAGEAQTVLWVVPYTG